jgi:ABC-2 type transport system permease protein
MMPAASHMIGPAVALAQREVVRFFRQPSRVIGALITPLIFWLLIGSGVGSSFQMPGQQSSGGYSLFFYPGAIMMVVLFTAIFSTFSVIEDRREGFLQGVLVSPAHRASIVLGKTLGGTFLASFQAMLFLLIAPLIGLKLSFAGVMLAGVMIVLGSFALTAMGLCIAWKLTSTQGFHSVMNLLLMPMWFLSGSLFPWRSDMAWPLKVAMEINPLTYVQSGLRHAMSLGDDGLRAAMPFSFGTSLLAAVLFAVLMFAAATLVVKFNDGKEPLFA